MKERPILFQGAMVRALLAGTKTQTRRALTPQPVTNKDWAGGAYWTKRAPSLSDPVGEAWSILDAHKACPYGQLGDRLWVRESYSGARGMRTAQPPWCWPTDVPIWYWADGNPEHGDWTKPKPGMHLPRWASRILLEVTAVRVERLQAISTRDCWAEGIPSSPDVDPVHEYRDLWERINGAGSWDANPWVWAVSFNGATQ